jgi:hypothetical protein
MRNAGHGKPIIAQNPRQEGPYEEKLLNVVCLDLSASLKRLLSSTNLLAGSTSLEEI